MNTALVYNAHVTGTHTEFDTPATIAMITRELEGLGHRVTPLEVTRPIDEVARALRRLAPELVFNLAEGERGAFREAVIPMLCDQLGLRCTGSSPSVLAVTLDKALAKRVVGQGAVGQLVRRAAEVTLEPPVIVKPNFEGSSIGITQASVVLEGDVHAVVARALHDYPAGVLVERYIDGWDAAVGYLAGEILPPVRYAYQPTGPHRIYDAILKRDDRLAPLEEVEPALAARLCEQAGAAFHALGVTGFARADFRITRDGEPVFLEVNALPSLSPTNNELYRHRAPRDVIAAIVGATMER